MNIIELANTVKDGDEVRRKNWDKASIIVWNENLDTFYTGTSRSEYEIGKEDILADNWVIVKKKTAFEKFKTEKIEELAKENTYIFPTGIAESAWNAAVDNVVEYLESEHGMSTTGPIIMDIAGIKVKQ